MGFSLVAARGLLSSFGARAPERMGSVVCSTQVLSLRHASSVVVAHGLSCPTTGGILVPWTGPNPRLLHCKVDSLPLDHQGSPSTYSFFFLRFYLFIYFWLRWVFTAACGLSLVAASRGCSLLWCTGFSLRWLLLLWSTGSRRTGFSSCGTWAQ